MPGQKSKNTPVATVKLVKIKTPPPMEKITHIEEEEEEVTVVSFLKKRSSTQYSFIAPRKKKKND